MTVWSRDVGRGDVVLHRGATERVGARWEQDKLDGRGYVPVDLTGWTATLTLTLPDGTDAYAVGCATTDSGLAWAEISAGALAGAEWDARPNGSWRIDATGPGGVVERLGEGHWHLS